MFQQETDKAYIPKDWRILFALILTFLWFCFLWIYIARNVGWGSFLDLPIAEMGAFLEGAFAFLAFLWLVIGLFIQQSVLAQNNEELRRTNLHSEKQTEAIAATEELVAAGGVARAAQLAGLARAVVDATVEYTTGRKQFGRPVGSFQAVQHRCADLRVALDGGRMLTCQAAWKLDQGLAADEEVAMAKAQAGSLSRLATETGHSIFAGISFTVEHDMQLYSARAKIAEANLGDTGHHLDLLAALMES